MHIRYDILDNNILHKKGKSFNTYIKIIRYSISMLEAEKEAKPLEVPLTEIKPDFS